jgi:hypothetical protein
MKETGNLLQKFQPETSQIWMSVNYYMQHLVPAAIMGTAAMECWVD